MDNVPKRELVALGGLLIVLAATVAAQRDRTPARPALPPLSMTCLHHPDVIESAPGTCPYCKMTLLPVRLAPAWTCPVHPATITETAGTCRLCKRQLVPVTVSLTWSCAGSDTDAVEPGLCLDGKPRTMKRSLRPHGDHNPRHGGQFFMAPDNWHHVEGIHPADRVFRLYVYDDYARPLSPARIAALNARVVTRERYDPTTRQTTELATFPLKPVRSGAYLEARLDPTSLPAAITAKVQFARGGPEHRFDFTFRTLTPAPVAPVATTSSTARGGAPATTSPRTTATNKATDGGNVSKAPTDPSPSSPTAGPTEPIPEPDPALVPLPIPDTVNGILEQLRTRSRQIEGLIARGDFGAVWVPAFQAKDLAIALEPRLEALSPAQRDGAASAVHQVVRLSWLLDASGDVGNRQQLTAVYSAFSSAVTAVLSAFAELGQP